LDTEIADLQAQNTSLASTVTALAKTSDSLSLRLKASETAHSDSTSDLAAKRCALQKSRKRVKRLEHNKKKASLARKTDQRSHSAAISALKTELYNHLLQLSSLTTERNTLQAKIQSHHQSTAAAADTSNKLRKERKLFRMQAKHNKEVAEQLRTQLKEISTWNAKSGRMYSMETRRLVLRIAKAGAAEDKVRDVIIWCAEVFGVHVLNLGLSARTVGRMKKEGGYISLIQIGREITTMYSA
jgi:chromosome segregation ATPase